MSIEFPHFTFSGTPMQRGVAYGEALRQRIHTTYNLYADSLLSNSPLSTRAIRQRAEHLRQLIGEFSTDYLTELDAVARGANLATWKIYVLNGRTEILNTPASECTAIFFAGSAILGQNWDWVAELENLAVLVTWALPDGHEVITFTEPGMLGKIGFNDRGLGVCLNILFSEHALDGVPVHVLTRAVLDCGSVAEARALFTRSGYGKSSHFLIGHADGDACSIEFAAGESFEVQSTNNVFLHTNHCIARGAERKSAIIPTTTERLEQGQTWLARSQDRDTKMMRNILLDDSQGSTSINASYHPEALLDDRNVGTCATIVMDLPAREMQIKKGPGRAGEFTHVRL